MLTPDEIRRYIGMVLGGRYRLNELIGQGGMGAVFRATDPTLTREVAVKVISVGEVPDRELHRSRFVREARLAANIRHPNVVVVHDFGTHSDASAGVELDYIVMELLPGEDLAKWLPRLSPADLSSSIDILVQAARGLAAGHRRSITHRDVKPRNFVVCHGDAPGAVDVKVVDFGIAKSHLPSDDPTDNTIPGFVGSERYASPEHLRGGARPSPAWDVFSLGVVAYEVLSGSYPFTDDDRTRLRQQLQVQPRSPRALNPAIPPAVEAVVLRCLRPDPADRYPDAGAVAAALEGAWTGSAPAATDGTLVVPQWMEIDGTMPYRADPAPVRGQPRAVAAAPAHADAQSPPAGSGEAEDADRTADPAPGPTAPARSRSWAGVAALAGLVVLVLGAVVAAGMAIAANRDVPGAIELGRPLRGELVDGDSITAAGKRFDEYRYQGEEGKAITFTLDSAGFDAELEWGRVENGAWRTLEGSGGVRPAQLHVTVLDTSEYRLRVRAAHRGATGSYAVTAAGGTPALSPGAVVRGRLTPADSALAPGVWAEDWKLQRVPAGSQVTVTVHPEGFLARVEWWHMEAGRWTRIEEAMSEVSAKDAQLTATVAAGGEYRVRVKNRLTGDAGPYTLRVATGAREIGPGAQVTSRITRADTAATGGPASEQWIYRGGRNEPVMLWLRSPGRMMLEWWHLVGTQWTELKAVATNGGPAMMLVRPSSEGDYYLRAQGVTPTDTGAYTIEPVTARFTGTLQSGAMVSESIGPGDAHAERSYADLWEFPGTPGQLVSIEMRTYGFSPALSFGCWTADGVWQKIHDDVPYFSGYARVDATVGGTGECAVRAASGAPGGGFGSYTLVLYAPEPAFIPKM